jgi:hypothetical protein
MATEEEPHRSWRGWHVIGRFLPMIILGVFFLVFGMLGGGPTQGGKDFAMIFVWIGFVLLAGAVFGMLFTKCPLEYETRWVVCVQEPDVRRTPQRDGYYRELSNLPEEES